MSKVDYSLVTPAVTARVALLTYAEHCWHQAVKAYDLGLTDNGDMFAMWVTSAHETYEILLGRDEL